MVNAGGAPQSPAVPEMFLNCSCALLAAPLSIVADGAGARGRMVARVQTVAFQGIEAVPVDVQAQFTSGVPAFVIVGLPELRTYGARLAYKF